MKCGLYETDITPSLGSEIPGQFYMRISDGILDKLYAHAVYMCNNEGEKAVIVSCDAILIPDKTAEEARIAIAEKLDMKKECIMVVATHTHTGGPVETWDDFVHEDPRYIEFLRSRIVDAACMAHQVQRNVRIGYGKGYEDRIAYYRDYVFADGTYRTNAGMGGDKKPFGPIDPEVGVLRIDLPDGTPYGAIVNYTCHCDCVGGTKYSADYPGAMKETLKKVFGPSFIPVYINGFCGNINHLDFEKGFHQAPEHYKRMGRMLAAEVIRTRETAPLCDNVKIDGAHEYFTIPTREPDEELLKWAAKVRQMENPSVVDRFYAEQAFLFQKEGVKQIPVVIQTLRIGDLAVYGMPGEIYVEFAHYLKKHSPSKFVMSANLANGCVGYIPIKELFKPGIYEARLCVTSQLIPDAGYIMQDRLLELAKKIW